MAQAEDLPKWLISPGEAFARQQRLETSVLLAMERMTLQMLEEMKGRALSFNLTAADSSSMWESTVRLALAAGGILPSDQGYNDLREVLTDDLGDEAYLSAMAVMRAAAETYPAPSRTDIETALTTALELDTPSLTASGASILARLSSFGMTWRARIRRNVRTGFTGLMGVTAQSYLASRRFPAKMWVTRHDEDVRSTHAAADGQTVPIHASFVVGGVGLMYPGDRSGPIRETINCRCVMIGARD